MIIYTVYQFKCGDPDFSLRPASLELLPYRHEANHSKPQSEIHIAEVQS